MTASTVWLRGYPVELGLSVAEHVDDWMARELPTLERTPAQVALNDWILEEFVRQLHGEKPRAWAEVAGRV